MMSRNDPFTAKSCYIRWFLRFDIKLGDVAVVTTTAFHINNFFVTAIFWRHFLYAKSRALRSKNAGSFTSHQLHGAHVATVTEKFVVGKCMIGILYT